MKDLELSPPERLTATQDLSAFHCGEAALDEWLKSRALGNEARGASRTYVVRAGDRVAGYYSLAVGAVAHAQTPGRLRRNMPDPLPVMILGRLAIDTDFQGRGLGRALLRDAVLRTLQAAEIAGIRAMLVHALSEAAKEFYVKCGFLESPVNARTLMLPLADAERIVSGR